MNEKLFSCKYFYLVSVFFLALSSCAYWHKLVPLKGNLNYFEFRFSQFYIEEDEQDPPSRTANRLLEDSKYKKYCPYGFSLIGFNGHSRGYASYTVACK